MPKGTLLRLRRKTQWRAALAKPHQCPHCERKYAHAGSLTTHIQIEHSGSERPTCDKCGMTFYSLKNLRDHVTRKHTVNPRMLKCPWPGCKKRFRTKTNLRKHKATHAIRLRRFKCPHCDFAATSRVIRDTHIAHRHPDPSGYACEECAYVGRNAACLKRHVQSVHRQERHTCPQCGLSYSNASNLRTHQKMEHARQWKWHRCQICPKKFRTQRELQVHVGRRHSTEEDRVQCPHCDFVAKHVYSLAGHIAYSHPDPAGFPCKQCEFVARNKYRLREHVSRTHGDDIERRSPSRGRSRSRSLCRMLSRCTEDWGERVTVDIS